jgi:hypothetical protein
MSLAVLRSRALAGMEALRVSVEVHLGNGLPSLTIVGLPDAEVRESKDRVRAALQNAGFEFPQRRITINLSPADLPKESGYRLVGLVYRYTVSSMAWTYLFSKYKYHPAGMLSRHGKNAPDIKFLIASGPEVRKHLEDFNILRSTSSTSKT